MKRIILIFLLLVTLVFTGCVNAPSSAKMPDEQTGGSDSEITDDAAGMTDYMQSDGEIDVDITEKMYVAYINEVYVNTDVYIGKTIRIQGMFQAYTDDTDGKTYYYVFRTGPGCCGNDGSMCGFEFTWAGDMPKDDDWIEVVGILRTYEDDGWTYLTLDAKSVTIMEKRGAESVYQ